ncbi:MAG: hypothetical protein CO065_08945 [Comamonadaceae bacterium CG_4_9_14_0_8_um_filter_57_21]|nr:MAG: hypothetical protein COY49_12220 [Comamonadaceae bacterium CG_4_10_14_0_8_um_filter_57_29]PJC18163.1 MAG: hypothetical protein CO065_08945 [Comamonadaceae bacterium CG_4_9_14_0_8_um_filter_57_21]
MDDTTSCVLWRANMGRAIKNVGQIALCLMPMHAAKAKLFARTANIRAVMSDVSAVEKPLLQTYC